VAGSDEKRPARGGSFYGASKLLVRRKANAADGRSRAVEVFLQGQISIAVEAQVSTAAGELALTVAGEPVSIRVGEMAGTGAEELVAP